jgi:GDP-4-dehydro-6-deoxy-D-mannose reductase
MISALITGISGFIGCSLHRYLLSRQIRVYGYDVYPAGHAGVFQGNISDRGSLLSALRQSKPNIVFHLAGILKSADITRYYNVHVAGTAVLLDAVLEAGLRPHVMIASSSAVYGAAIGKRPITESFTPHPVTHYAASKLAQEIVALRYHASCGLPVTCIRTFNLLGPGLSPDMAPSAFAKQIAQAELKHKPNTIYTGDLSARRDYVDVRDAVRAYYLIARHGRPGQIYNVCSERAISVEECLRILMGRAKVQVEVAYDPLLEQKHDVPIQVGSAKKIRRELGWRAKTPIRQSLSDLLQDWRDKLQQEQH